MCKADNFFIEEITGTHPEVSEITGIELLNAIADEAENRLAFMPDKSKVCSFCGQTTEEMFPVYNYRYANIGNSCSNCMSDNYCVVCGEEPSEDTELYSYELLRGNYTAVCVKCFDRIEESGTN